MQYAVLTSPTKDEMHMLSATRISWVKIVGQKSLFLHKIHTKKIPILAFTLFQQLKAFLLQIDIKICPTHPESILRFSQLLSRYSSRSDSYKKRVDSFE